MLNILWHTVQRIHFLRSYLFSISWILTYYCNFFRNILNKAWKIALQAVRNQIHISFLSIEAFYYWAYYFVLYFFFILVCFSAETEKKTWSPSLFSNSIFQFTREYVNVSKWMLNLLWILCEKKREKKLLLCLKDLHRKKTLFFRSCYLQFLVRSRIEKMKLIFFKLITSHRCEKNSHPSYNNNNDT